MLDEIWSGWLPKVIRALEIAHDEGWPVGVDTETVGCDPRKESPYGKAQLVLWSLGIPTHEIGNRGQRLAQRVVLFPADLAWAADWLDGPARKVFHNGLYDRHVFRNAGYRVGGPVYDTLDLSRLMDPEGEHGLKYLMGKYLQYQPVCEFRDFSRPVTRERTRKAWVPCPRCRRDLSGERVPCGLPGCGKRGAHAGEVAVVETYTATLASTEMIPLTEIVPGHADYTRLVDYATLDAKATAELFSLFIMHERMALPAKVPDMGAGRCRVGTVWNMYEAVFRPFTDLLFEMAVTGMQVDGAYCASAAVAARADEAAVHSRIRGWDGQYWPAPEPLNWRSAPQVASFLHGILGLPLSPVAKKGRVKKGKVSTDSEALAYLADHAADPAVKAGLRDVLKLRNIWSSLKYLDKLPRFQDAAGRVHPVCGWSTKTGRLAMRAPEGQQIPINARKDAYSVRSAFTAAPGKVLIAADASQLEMRIQAHLHLVLFGDDTLARDIDAADCHSANAIRVFGAVYPDKVLSTGERFADLPPTTNLKKHPDVWAQRARDDIKAVVYGIAYGKGAYGLGASLRDDAGEPIGEEAAQKILDALFVVYPAMAKLQAWIESFVTTHGYIQTLLGRRRWLEGALSEDAWQVKRACRQAMNNPMQGGGADLVIIWMLLCRRDADLQARAVMTAQVHDELLFEADPGHAEWVAKRVGAHLLRAGEILGMRVPITGSHAIGPSWATRH